MDPTQTRPTMYWKGDKAVYTGKSRVLYGATFYEYRWTEGHREGQTFLTQTKPA